MKKSVTEWLHEVVTNPALPAAMLLGAILGASAGLHVGRAPAPDPAALDQCAQSEAVCQAVAQRMGIYVTLPPWQAMVLAPILDPR